MKKYIAPLALALSVALAAPAALAREPGNSPGGVLPAKHVYYAGDTVEVRVVFPHALLSLWNGDADAHVVVYVPGGVAITQKLPVGAPDQPYNWYTLPDLDTSTLPAGTYQMAMILTNPGGDPLLLDDWFGGFKGLVNVARVKIADGATDQEDIDGDGEIDGDADGDGYHEDANIDEDYAPEASDSTDDTGSDDTDGTGTDDTGSDDTDGTGTDGTGTDDTGTDGTDGTGTDDTGTDGTGTDDTGSDGTDGTGIDDTGTDSTDGTGSDNTGTDTTL